MDDTIFALASASGRSGVAVIRISGSNSLKTLKTLINKEIIPRKAIFSGIYYKQCKIDEGLVLFFKGPHSFTGEDCVELQLHGSLAVLDAIYAALTDQGLRLAEPGEFSKRAVINGKMDLTQAEGIADLIDAETQAQRHQALTQLEGGLSQQYQDWHSQLLDILSRLEVFIDFPDEELPLSLVQTIRAKISDLKHGLETALNQAERGRQIRDGYRIVILGAPNAGKSSLFNALLQSEAAIVTAQAGTTRDILQARLRLGAHSVYLYDTAGLRDAQEPIEQEGIRRAREIGVGADLRIWLIDSSAAEAQYDIEHGDMVILNKTDLKSNNLLTWLNILESHDILPLSLATKEGLDTVIDILTFKVSHALEGQSFPAATRQRHFDLLRDAIVQIGQAELILSSMPELASENIRSALKCFDALFGRYDIESVLDRIFSTFCIGK